MRLPSPLLVARWALLAWLLLAPAVHAQQAAVATLDGVEHSGRVVELNQQGVVLRSGAGEQRVRLAHVHWLRIESMRSLWEREGGFVELTSGTVVPVSQITTDGQLLTLSLLAPLQSSRGDGLELPYEHAASYVFERGDADLEQQWRRIRNTDSTADLIVIKRRDGQTLDFVEGIVTSITDQKVNVLLDGDPIAVARARVYGVVCFRPDAEPATKPPAARVTLPTGMLLADSVRWKPDATAQISVPGLADFQMPLESIRSIDFSRGGVLLLSDVDPLEVSWRPFFTPPGGLELVEQWGQLRNDHSYSGGLIALREPSGKLRSYAKGLAIRSQGHALYEVPDAFAYFRATIGIAPDSAADSAVELRIEGDGRELFARPFVAGEPPHEVELPISEVNRLRLIVDYGPGADAGDNLHFANARFTR